MKSEYGAIIKIIKSVKKPLSKILTDGYDDNDTIIKIIIAGIATISNGR